MSDDVTLSIAEREAIYRAGDHHPEVCDCTGYAIEFLDAPGSQHCPALTDTFATVERIVAARVAAAEQVTPERENPVDDPAASGGQITDDPGPVPLNVRSKLALAMFAGINEIGIPESDRLEFISGTVGRPIASSKEMTEEEARAVLAAIDASKAAAGEPS